MPTGWVRRRLRRLWQGPAAGPLFVAHLDEGITLRRILGGGATIAVLHGPLSDTEADFIAHDLVPVLSSLDQVSRWAAAALASRAKMPAILQVDTGMARFGLSEADVASSSTIASNWMLSICGSG